MSDPLPIGTILKHPCPECGEPMVLRDSRYGLFYGCTTYPKCKSTHGAHKKTGEPLGIPGNAETKKARIRAHDSFDQLWKVAHMERADAYVWMQEAMEMTGDEAHIGKFTIDLCDQLELLVEAYLEEKGDK